MVSPLLFGVAASSGLVVGAVLGAVFDVPDRVVGVTLAFASGALITALAFDLFAAAFDEGGALVAGVGLFAGVGVFTVTDWALNEYAGGEEASGIALLASVVLDGIPENAALGVALIGAADPLALLLAIFASNFPEALDGAEYVVDGGNSTAYAVGIWTVTAAVLAATVVVGNAVFAGVGAVPLAFVRSFAGGAVLAGVADETLPDAFEEGGFVVSVATAAGFFATFLLK